MGFHKSTLVARCADTQLDLSCVSAPLRFVYNVLRHACLNHPQLAAERFRNVLITMNASARYVNLVKHVTLYRIRLCNLRVVSLGEFCFVFIYQNNEFYFGYIYKLDSVS